MTDHSTPWPVGAPTWVDISVTDIERSKAFDSTVLGWDFEGGGEDFGGYLDATVDGRKVAGMAPPMDVGPFGQQPSWTLNIEVDDVDATAQRVTEAGGQVTTEAFDDEFGRLAMVTGPDGEPFGLVTSSATA
jgi:hypothetical protein